MNLYMLIPTYKIKRNTFIDYIKCHGMVTISYLFYFDGSSLGNDDSCLLSLSSEPQFEILQNGAPILMTKLRKYMSGIL